MGARTKTKRGKGARAKAKRGKVLDVLRTLLDDDRNEEVVSLVSQLVARNEAQNLPMTSDATALHRQLRKVLKTRGHLPSDEAALKLLFLAVRNAEKSWGGRPTTWGRALMQLAIHFDGRLPQ